jgi:hypothetical protein
VPDKKASDLNEQLDIMSRRPIGWSSKCTVSERYSRGPLNLRTRSMRCLVIRECKIPGDLLTLEYRRARRSARKFENDAEGLLRESFAGLTRFMSPVSPLKRPHIDRTANIGMVVDMSAARHSFENLLFEIWALATSLGHR